MGKNGRAVFLAIIGLVVLFAGCPGAREGEAATAAAPQVGMVADYGTMDDRSFNQGTWQGIVRAGKELNFTPVYLLPAGPGEADYDREIAVLHAAGYRLIVTPGFRFAGPVYRAQAEYPDACFVLLDGEPRPSGGYDKGKIGPNTVAVVFAEHEAGFLAGVAAALRLKSGDFGFIGGVEIPPVQRYNWGFQQGVRYANANFGTSVRMKAENFVYQGTFHDAAGGRRLAAQMYDRGVNAIFTAAGAVGGGVIDEAAARARSGRMVWVVGVDADQYELGFYDQGKTKSVVLTSAMKRVDQAAYDMVKSAVVGNFPGGRRIVWDAKNNGVGLPARNPNLPAAVMGKVKKVASALRAGKITVAAGGEGLLR